MSCVMETMSTQKFSQLLQYFSSIDDLVATIQLLVFHLTRTYLFVVYCVLCFLGRSLQALVSFLELGMVDENEFIKRLRSSPREKEP